MPSPPSAAARRAPPLHPALTGGFLFVVALTAVLVTAGQGGGADLAWSVAGHGDVARSLVAGDGLRTHSTLPAVLHTYSELYIPLHDGSWPEAWRSPGLALALAPFVGTLGASDASLVLGLATIFALWALTVWWVVGSRFGQGVGATVALVAAACPALLHAAVPGGLGTLLFGSVVLLFAHLAAEGVGRADLRLRLWAPLGLLAAAGWCLHPGFSVGVLAVAAAVLARGFREHGRGHAPTALAATLFVLAFFSGTMPLRLARASNMGTTESPTLWWGLLQGMVEGRPRQLYASWGPEDLMVQGRLWRLPLHAGARLGLGALAFAAALLPLAAGRAVQRRGSTGWLSAPRARWAAVGGLLVVLVAIQPGLPGRGSSRVERPALEALEALTVVERTPRGWILASDVAEQLGWYAARPTVALPDDPEVLLEMARHHSLAGLHLSASGDGATDRSAWRRLRQDPEAWRRYLERLGMAEVWSDGHDLLCAWPDGYLPYIMLPGQTVADRLAASPDGEALQRIDLSIWYAPDVGRLRRRLEGFIWGSPGLPTGGPERIDRGVQGPLADVPGLERVDALTIPMGSGQQATTHHLVPSRPNGELVVVHQGHACAFDADGVGDLARALVARGHAVLAVSMPGCGQDDCRGVCIDRHEELFAEGSKDEDSPIRFFVEPVVSSLNALAADYERISMAGLSGGGWTTTLCAALDPRITTSVSVAGTLPRALRWGGSLGDVGPCTAWPATPTCTCSRRTSGGDRTASC